MNYRHPFLAITSSFLIACSTTIQKGPSLDHTTLSIKDIQIQPPKPAHEVEAAYEAAAQDPCSEPVTDQDGDGRATQRDLYMRDYDHTQRGEPICQIYDYGVEPRRITFDFNEATLKPRALKLLDENVVVFKAYPDLIAEVAGHADSVGPDSYNQQLSLRRARAVYDYLIMNGVDASQLRGPNGYGEIYPIAHNINEDGSDNPKGRENNRRVEFNIQN